ncbi:MAG: hypothetical protein FWF59_02255 [Turicibacter sp.]|nr:hypothetical protein [Turicibacter sp.]
MNLIYHIQAQLVYYILALVTGILTAVYRTIQGFIKAQKISIEEQRLAQAHYNHGTRDLLRYNMHFIAKEVRKAGCCCHADKENMDAMYKSYKELGGNGHMDQIYREVMEAPSPPTSNSYFECTPKGGDL